MGGGIIDGAGPAGLRPRCASFLLFLGDGEVVVSELAIHRANSFNSLRAQHTRQGDLSMRFRRDYSPARLSAKRPEVLPETGPKFPVRFFAVPCSDTLN